MSSDQQWQDAYDKIENDYAECKIEKDEFIQAMHQLGMGTTDIAMALDMAIEARAEYKLDLAKKS
jgi:folate-dependent tRNA-U54 methylase TrmFO/GidA